MNSLPNLHVNWCSHKAAQHAVDRWHYSRSLPGARKAYIGVWESDRFIGAVVFGIGSGSVTNGSRYGLARSHEMAELCRVALGRHVHPVSKIVSIACRMIQRNSPGLRLLISFADPRQGHIGIIYQALNWIYTGTSAPDVEYFCRGKWRHHRSASSLMTSVAGLPSRKLPGKHRYLYPLDKAMRERIAPFSRPYPKRRKDSSEPSANHAEEGGAAPTPALQQGPSA